MIAVMVYLCALNAGELARVTGRSFVVRTRMITSSAA